MQENNWIRVLAANKLRSAISCILLLHFCLAVLIQGALLAPPSCKKMHPNLIARILPATTQ